jgi:hypothetical protein
MSAEAICAWCGVTFQSESSNPLYCKRSHSTSAYRARRKAAGWVKPTRTDCPHPQKVAYPDFETALRKLALLTRPDLEVYPCRCGQHHIGHTPRLWVEQRAALIESYEGATA